MSSIDFCVILAGGQGRRLWPVSRKERPKQFIDFFGTGRSLLQSTYDRFCGIVPADHIYICTCPELEGLVREQLPDLTEEQLLVEPIHRNTAPCVAWANRRIRFRCPEARVIVSPSDQLVLHEDKFLATVAQAFEFVGSHNDILTIGVTPSRPEPGYGYIQMGDETDTAETFKVKSFTEKPDRDFATMFMQSGEFLWNTGLVLANVECMRRAFMELFPEIYHWLDAIDPADGLQCELDVVSRHFTAMPNISLDRGILEKADNVAVMRCEFGWADVGSWHSVYEAVSAQSGDNVVLHSEVMLDNCHDNIICLPKGSVGVISGLEGFIVAEHDNVLLICKKSDSSSAVRRLANLFELKIKN